MIQASNLLRCAECRYEAPALDFMMRGKQCARCGSSWHVDPDNDFIIVGHRTTEAQQGGVWIRLNWQEFRILAMWARFWADHQAQQDHAQWGWMLRVVDSITHQLKKIAPEWPLTIADDAEIERKRNPEQPVRAQRPDGTEVQLEPTWLNQEQTRPEPPPPHAPSD